MRRRLLMAAGLAAAAALRLPAHAAGAADAPRLHLLLQYESRAIGQDGVQRDSRHADRMFRDRDAVWIERERPAVLRESAAHDHRSAPGPHAGHAHEQAQGAPLYVRLGADGRAQVQAVLQAQRRVIDVDLAHYGNVGYGGSWAAAWGLIDPQALAHMEKLGAPRQGVQRYRLRQGERTTLVAWDIAGQYARSIAQHDHHGLSSQRMTAVTRPLPARMPWQGLQGYARGDYSDLLD